MKQGPFPPDRLCCPVHRRYYDPLRLPLGRPPLPGVTGYRRACFPGRRPGAEEALSSSQDNLLTVPRPIRRGGSWAPAPGSLVPSVAFAVKVPARLPLGRLRGFLLRRRRLRFMLRTGQLPSPRWDVVAPLRRRDLARRREPRYRGPWRLPGPDSHRLAALSLSLGYVMSTSLLTGRPSCWTHTST